MDQLFGVSKTDTDKLWAGISNTSTEDGSLKSTNDYQPLKPMLSIISEKTLSCSTSVKSYINQFLVQLPEFSLFSLTDRFDTKNKDIYYMGTFHVS